MASNATSELKFGVAPQLSSGLLFQEAMSHSMFPGTRYQGSKLKLLDWIWEGISHLAFDSALDLFSGSASVSYMLKTKGKRVVSNDYLKANQVVGRALVENSGQKLVSDDLTSFFRRREGVEYGSFIEDNFSGIFYPDDENRLLDIACGNIHALEDGYLRDIAFFALFQSCLAKRPYNLFHRANLYMRTADVKRSFGNKATWDKPFEKHFADYVSEANRSVFDNGRDNLSVCGDYLDAPANVDLVYADPPYLNSKGVGVDYLDFYHLLEGIISYSDWVDNICLKYKHRPFIRKYNIWNDKKSILSGFDAILEKYKNSIIVFSYRSNGIPSEEEIEALIRRHGRKGSAARGRDYKYVLSHGRTRELLFVTEP